MTLILDLLSFALLAVGLFFFVAGAVGLIRFPDVFSRLHALTKADNLGLGFVAMALALRAGSPTEVFKLALIWLLVLAASASVGHLIASESLRRGRRPWQRSQPGQRGTESC